MTQETYIKAVASAAEKLKTISHPTRFCIVCKLSIGPLNVSQMQECLEVTQSNVSQHLTILKAKGIIVGERNGNEILYFLIDDEIRKAINIFIETSEIPR